jgi:hypothetical protein
MRARVGQASWPVFPGIDRWRVCHIATHGRKPIDGNPSLTVWALIGAPSVSERVTLARVFHEVSRAERLSQDARRPAEL